MLGIATEGQGQVSVPTMIVLGRRDFNLDAAQKFVANLDVEQKYIAIPPTGHAGPAWDGGPADTIRMVNMYAVAFFTETLKEDSRYRDVLTEKYVWEYELKRPTDQVYFFESAVTDADGDWRTGFSDFLILSQNFGQSVAPDKLGGVLGKSVGDFDLDGAVDFRDFLLLSNNFSGDVGNAATSSVQMEPTHTLIAVPEPQTSAIAFFVVLDFIRLSHLKRSSAHYVARHGK